MNEYESANANRRSKWPLIIVVFVLGCVGGVYGLREYQLGKFVSSAKAYVTNLFSNTSTKINPYATPAATSPAVDTSIAAITPATATASTATNGDAQRELQELRAEIARLRAAQNPTANYQASQAAPTAPVNQPFTAPTNATGQLTLNFWNNLNTIFAREAAMRSAPPKLDAGNAGAFVSGRTQAFQYAADAIRRLDARGIDPTLAAFSQEIAGWYDQGIANSQLAESLLGSSDIASRQGVPGQSWQAAEKAHREKVLEINARGAQLQQEFIRKYGLQFPALQ